MHRDSGANQPQMALCAGQTLNKIPVSRRPNATSLSVLASA
jgi:hypothetical protein